MVYKFFDKKSSNTHKGILVNSYVVSENKELAEKLHKPIIREFEIEKYTHLLNTISGVLISRACN